jgi:hypothetical protein
MYHSTLGSKIIQKKEKTEAHNLFHQAQETPDPRYVMH